MTARIGFEVMGIWDDDASFDDVNSTCATRRGFPTLDLSRWAWTSFLPDLKEDFILFLSTAIPSHFRLRLADSKTGEVPDAAVCVDEATEEDSADGVPGGGYILTADDRSNVKLFNYPVVWDDAPHKVILTWSGCGQLKATHRAVISHWGQFIFDP